MIIEPETESESSAAVANTETPQYKEPPQGGDSLAKEWKKRYERAKRRWDKFHKRVKHNRKLVAGFDWEKNPDDDSFYQHRANLIHGTITSILPNIYARNPEISVSGRHKGRDLKLLCQTIEKVTTTHLEEAKLKKRAKATVRAALTVSFGCVKVMYQRDIQEDPHVKARIQDTKDNIQHIESLIMALNDPHDPQQCADQEAQQKELEETLAALEEKAEVVAAEGLVIDRILTDHLILDDALAEFDDYADGDFIIQRIPMRRDTAEGLYGYKLDGATAYKSETTFPGGRESSSGKVFSGDGKAGGDTQIVILEIWDKKTQRVFTMAEGCDFWLKEPFSPNTGERWYPFFLLPFQLVDGTVIGPSLVDLTEQLQKEHNDARQKFNDHREMIKPGWVASQDIDEKSIRRYVDSVMGEITLLDGDGKPVSQIIMPKQHPPIDPAAYDTSVVRFDWEQVSGMQDAARSTVVQPKTATEASIMQQSLSGRVSEFRDQVEDFLQEISQYGAQLLLLELTPAQVEKIMGPHAMGPLTDANGQPLADPATGQPMTGVVEPAYDWPQLSKEEVFGLVQLKIRAGSMGVPDRTDQQETVIKLIPVLQPLIQQIQQMQLAGQDPAHWIALMKEVVGRFDDKLDVEQFVPKMKPMQPEPPAAPAMPQLPPQISPQFSPQPGA